MPPHSAEVPAASSAANATAAAEDRSLERTRNDDLDGNFKRSIAVPGKDWWALRDYPPPGPRMVRLCPRLWQAWVVGLVAGSVLLLDQNIFVYAGFIAAAFLATVFIPDSGDIPSPFFMHLAIPFLAVKGVQEGGMWTAINFYWAFFFLPFADFVVGVDTFNKGDKEYKALRDRKTFRIASWIFLPAQLSLLAYACHAVNTIALTPMEFFGFVVSVAVYTGGLGITLSHELVHKSNRLEQWLGRAMCVVISYGHFYVEHNRGHHKQVATEEDPATARYGESFYAFLPRCVGGSFLSAWRLETDRLRDRNLPFYHNEMLWYWSASGFLCAVLTAAFGPKTIPLFLGQSFVGIMFFESVNYVEHYGLERKQNEQGKPEPVGFEHSWDAPHRLTNMVLFKLQRHGDHHVNSTRRYQTLRAEPSRSPQLPLGYPGCILLALCPPLWRFVMDRRVLKLRKKHPGRVWRHGPSS